VIRNLVLSGGPGHDFDATSQAIADLLADRSDGPHAATEIVDDPVEAGARLRAGHLDGATPVDLFTVNALHWRMDAERYADLRDQMSFTLDPALAATIDAHVRRGGGLLALHTAVICFDADPTWRALTGASWNWERSSHPPVGPVDVDVTDAGRRHPITAGIEAFEIVDECYGFLDEQPAVDPLLTAPHGGRRHPLLWARQVDEGRVVTDVLGHGIESIDHPSHRTILRRSAAWASASSTAGSTT
jgi:hypothetical protein